MSEVHSSLRATPRPGLLPQPQGRQTAPEHQEGSPLSVGIDLQLAPLLAQTLDHVGHGVFLVTAGARLIYCNRPGREALRRNDLLTLRAGQLQPLLADDEKVLANAIDAALRHGARSLCNLKTWRLPAHHGYDPAAPNHKAVLGPERSRAVAVIPMNEAGMGCRSVMVSLPMVCRSRDPALQCFASQHGLTPTERAVLEALVAGDSPADIAKAHATALTTVRSHIGQLRSKTATHSIAQLIESVNALPSMAALG